MQQERVMKKIFLVTIYSIVFWSLSATTESRCFTGSWEVTGGNNFYTGYYDQGVKASVKAKVSVETVREDDTRLVFDGKLSSVDLDSGKLYLINNIFHAKKENKTELVFINELPAEPYWNDLLTGRTPKPKIYSVKKLAKEEGARERSPSWLKLEPEILEKHNIPLVKLPMVFDISVAWLQSSNSQKDWEVIGKVTLDKELDAGDCAQN